MAGSCPGPTRGPSGADAPMPPSPPAPPPPSPGARGGSGRRGAGPGGGGPPPLSRQLSELGRQALAQGEAAQARTFFRKALELDPNNAEASRALSRQGGVVRVALQDPP